jgi:DNA processing protein
MLAEVPSPPQKIYFKGNYCPEIFQNCLAVVGSRKMSVYGVRVIEKIFSVLHKDISIVSGFMSGVDAEAHRRAIKLGLRTIAVMPCGIDYIHPENQADLYEEILSNEGLILSEFEGDFKPKSWTYPKRNRIVAGLSRAVLVVEASKNSGSLITARMANSYGRKVFVVPGSIFSNLSEGKTQISNEFAINIDSGFSINEFFGFGSGTNTYKNEKKSDSGNNVILETLKNDPMTMDELSEYLSVDISTLNKEVTYLLMSGLVTESEGKFYAC